MMDKGNNISRPISILFVNRPDMFTIPGGDTTHMLRLKEGLDKLGARVDISAEVFPDPLDYDIINVFNLLIPQQTLRQIMSLRAQSLSPVVLTPFYWDRSESLWGEAAVSMAVEKAANTKELDYLLSQVANGKLNTHKYSRNGNNRLYADYEIEQKTALQFVDHLIPISLKEQNLLVRKFGFPEANCTAIMTGTDFPKKKALPDLFIKKYGIKDFVLITGRVETRKNQLMLLYALRETKLPIVVSGSQSDKRYLQLCQKVAPANTFFVGRLDEEMLISARAAARVHALPSWWECAGISHMEAALDGCNIVVGNKAAEPEYFGDGAYYCDPSDVNSIRSAVLSAYNNYEKDSARIEKLQNHILKNYDWNLIAEKYLEAYYKINIDHYVDAEKENRRKSLQQIAQAYHNFLKGNLSTTAQMLPSLISLAPDNSLVYFLAGKTSMMIDQPEKAFSMFQFALKQDPDNTQIKRNYGQTLLALKKYDEAQKIFEDVLMLSPDDTEARWLLSRTFASLLMWDKSLEILETKKFQHQNEKSASVVVLAYNSAKTILKCLQSVDENLRVDDEVIIVDNNSNDKTCSIIQKFISHKDQFKLIRNKENMGFAAGTNVGIKASKNPFVVLLNPDTIATENWLDKLIFHFNMPEIAAVGPLSNYVAGHQKIQLHLKKIPKNLSLNEISELLFKANKERSIETKLLIGFCIAVRRDVLDKLGFLDENLFLGNDDLELSWRLRVNRYKLKVAIDTFVHHEGQQSFNSKPKELTNNLVQQSTDALYYKLQEYYGSENVPTPEQLWDINWFTPTNANFNSEAKILNIKSAYQENTEGDTEKTVSIITLTYNGLEYTKQFYESLCNTNNVDHELIIIDNASTDETKDYLKAISTNDKSVKVIFNDHNAGFPAAINQGIQAASGKYILIANNDIVFTNRCIDRLLEVAASDSAIGIVGPISNEVSGAQKDNYADYKSIEEMHGYALQVKEKNKNEVMHFPRVAFLCTLIKRELINKIGGLDERFTPGNYEDDDFCLRAQLAGFKTVIAKDIFIHHYGSKSFKAEGINKYSERLRINRQIFIDKWGADPDELWIQKKEFNHERSLFVSINKDELTQRIERARSNIKDGEFELAFTELVRALNIVDSPDKTQSIITKEDLLNLIANVSLVLKDYEKAKEYFEESLNLNPSSSTACFGLGQVFFNSELFEQAKVMFEWAIKNDPNNGKALQALKTANAILSIPESHNSLEEQAISTVQRL